MSIGGHQRSGFETDEWLTPPEIIASLGDFDLDPCSPRERPWPTAKVHLTIDTDGLSVNWEKSARVWLNPPYGRGTETWIRRLAEHGNGVALIFARTETRIFFPWVWNYATSILFLQGRLHFYNTQGLRAVANAGAPSVLIAYGHANSEALKRSGIPGRFIHLLNCR